MKKAVIFDLDGLLIDSEIISYKMYADLLQKHNLRFTLDTYARHYSGKRRDEHAESDFHLSPADFAGTGARLRRCAEKGLLRRRCSAQAGRTGAAAFFETPRHQNPARLFQLAERALSVLAQYGIENCFDAMVFGPEIAHGKPAPDIFIKAREKSGEASADCLVLEDSEVASAPPMPLESTSSACRI